MNTQFIFKRLFYTFFTVLFLGSLSAQKEASIQVNGACGMCEQRIEDVANQVKGVKTADYDLQTKTLTVKINKRFSKDNLHEAISESGHDTDKLKAGDEIYANLPACCQYREIEDPIGEYEMSNYKSLWVDGICGMCQERIETAAMQLQGVEAANWNVNTKILSLKVSDGFYIDDLHTHLASVGHDTEVAKASDQVYNDLHGCCKYRDADVIAAHNPSTEEEDHEGHDHAPGEDHEDEEGHEGHDHAPGEHIDHADEAHENHDKHIEFLQVEDGHDIHGIILENTKEGQIESVLGATIYWEGTTDGTTTDSDGYFHLDKPEKSSKLIVSYVGYENDTIDMTGQNAVEILLKNNYVLDEISITHRNKSTQISFVNTMKVQQINQKELLKAACCSLSESFETTPSVDVSFTDAITGTRKIELLGLAGPYVQTMRENMPYIRGLAAIYGFSYTPGPWIESMQLNMGAASVINGPEAMTGQINVEIKKPNESERLFVNAYANAFQRIELNVNGTEEINDKWSTAYLFHGNNQNRQADIQNDGFMDAPISQQLIGMNRWKFSNGKGLQSQVGIKGTYLNKVSGQLFNNNNKEGLWIADVNTQRLEGWFKMGKVFADNPDRSIGFQFSTSYHDQDASFGSRDYDATQQSVYANLIYQTNLLSENHKLRAGASIIYDDFDESLLNTTFTRNEMVTGVFSEYHYKASEKLNFIAGIRGDYNNIYGAYVTPRLHIKYSPNETTAFRLVGGKGQRTATIFAENIGMFASNREIIIDSQDDSKPYGLDQEIAWNTGANITKEFVVNNKSLVISADYYYTYFVNQIVLDYDQNPQEVHLYNLDGESFSHSVQAQVDYEIVNGVDVRLAYRFNDVQTDYENGRLLKPLTSRHRAFMNVGWEFGEGWNVDGTLNYQGSKRIPSTMSNPEEYRFDETSPSFFTFNGQFSKFFKNGLELYLGTENLFNYVQENAIISADNPDSEYFDSSLIWGPVMGRNIYAGMRYRLF